MVKARMSTADVAAEVKCLRRLIGMRCANVYDISPKTYLFKLMNSSGITQSGESEKVLLLMESGARLHTTQYVRDKSTTPSGFTLKLRKHIRTKRLEDVRQLGYDRIILFQFGLGNNAHYVILELYAQGNILLTDSEYMVMTLLRSHRDDNKGLAIMSRHLYPTEACRTFKRTDYERLRNILTISGSSDASAKENDADAYEKPSDKKTNGLSSQNKSIDGAKSGKTTLKSLLTEALSYGPALSEHIILDAGLLPGMKIELSGSGVVEETIKVLEQALTRFEDWLADVISGQTIPEGYIFMQYKSSGNKIISQEPASNKIYDEYCPILLNQFKPRDYLKFDTFDAAVDEFYSKIETQRADHQLKAKEESAVQKLNKIRLDQENRVHALRKEVDHSIRMAELIEYNLEDVDAAILAVRVALASGMDWSDLALMVKEERKSGNPIAGLIDKLHLERNCITLLLSNNLDEMDDDERTAPVEKVEVDLSLSAHANARRWYEMKKKQENKHEKTVTAHTKAFKAAEKKTRLQIAQEKTIAAITHMRKVHWFEKFNWFISSENYLIISGRDAQQNEMIVKRYMSKGDIYVHAELHGASSTLIKNHRPDYPIPPLTLNQAGSFTVCHSQAWDSKIVTSAWWVYPHQVSKTAPTGEYLTVGSFMIRGKKNFLPPHPLVMGFSILFRLDESSLSAHLNERRVRGDDEGTLEMEESCKENVDSESDEIFSEEETNKESVEDVKPAVLPSEFEPNQKDDDAPLTDPSKEPSDTSKVEISPKENHSDIDKGNESFLSSELDSLIDRSLGLGPARVSTSSSIVDAFQRTSLQDHDHEEKKAVAREKHYISKAERRKLKKGLGGDGTESISQKSEASEISSSSSAQQERVKDSTKTVNQKIVRGQRGKLKKIKEKYAQQDEEEKEIRMTLLASSGRASRKGKVSDNGNESDTNKVRPTSGLDGSSKICYKCKKPGHLSRDCPEDVSDKSQLDKSKDSNGKSSVISGVDSDKVTSELDNIVGEEDGIQETGEEEKERSNDLDYLTGNPLASDVLLYAVPVCGPYNALQSYKYRVKVTPGTAKKGKAAKTAMSLFLHMPEITNREKELLKACTDPELVAAMVGNCKVTAAGLTQLIQKQKKGKKSSK